MSPSSKGLSRGGDGEGSSTGRFRRMFTLFKKNSTVDVTKTGPQRAQVTKSPPHRSPKYKGFMVRPVLIPKPMVPRQDGAYSWTSRENDPRPMKLCSICQALSPATLSLSKSESVRHQPSFSALYESAIGGCEMCLMFMDFTEVERCGEAPCFVEQDDWMGDITFAVATDFDKGHMSEMNRNYTRVAFRLSSYLGAIDESVSRCELYLLPTWKIARRWIDDCVDNHASCALSTDSTSLSQLLPTRVINVSPEGGGEPHLWISGGHRAAYVTLSHCWGHIKPLVTDSSTLAQYLVAIPSSKTPRTFQDVITATRELGFKYLWIDSLCIVQDSTEDWEREYTKMAQIYRNSVVTLSGSTATDSTMGFLHPRAIPERAPYLWEYKDAKTNLVQRATLQRRLRGFVHQFEPYDNELVDEESKSPLNKRGWIFQEYLLSPRLLFFGHYRMYWECSRCARFEDYPNDKFEGSTHSSIAKRKIHKIDFSKEPYYWDIWYQTVEEYTTRKLTNPRDRLSALSGIAQWMCGGENDRYVAGIIRQDLVQGLMWIAGSSGSQPFTCHGPSWSWGSINHPVIFSRYTKLHSSSSSDYLTERGRRELMSADSKKLGARIKDVAVKLKGLNPFGEVSSGSIKLEGKVVKAQVTRSTGIQDEEKFEIDFLSKQGTYSGKFGPDDWQRWSKLVSTKKSHGARIQNIKSPLQGRTELDVVIECLVVDVGYSSWVGLAIEPSGLPHIGDQASVQEASQDTALYKRYRRVGFISGSFRSTMETNITERDEVPFDDATWKPIELV
ncbi:MAG: hypothetical protein M1839_002773 [Geoglossum umbratile]|nr:MAG: hypothetical protein M1839_002773 [Geoglossum umbratile]